MSNLELHEGTGSSRRRGIGAAATGANASASANASHATMYPVNGIQGSDDEDHHRDDGGKLNSDYNEKDYLLDRDPSEALGGGPGLDKEREKEKKDKWSRLIPQDLVKGKRSSGSGTSRVPRRSGFNGVVSQRVILDGVLSTSCDEAERMTSISSPPLSYPSLPSRGTTFRSNVMPPSARLAYPPRRRTLSPTTPTSYRSSSTPFWPSSRGSTASG